MADVTKNTEESRYEIRVDGDLAGTQSYEVRPHGSVALTHTFVDDAHAGQGLAGELTRYSLDDIRSEGYTVEPECSYVARWIDKNEGYADLVASRDPNASAPATMEDVSGVDPQQDCRI